MFPWRPPCCQLPAVGPALLCFRRVLLPLCVEGPCEPQIYVPEVYFSWMQEWGCVLSVGWPHTG